MEVLSGRSSGLFSSSCVILRRELVRFGFVVLVKFSLSVWYKQGRSPCEKNNMSKVLGNLGSTGSLGKCRCIDYWFFTVKIYEAS